MTTEITIIEKFDSLTLKVKNPNFTFRLNRYSESCSGDITEHTLQIYTPSNFKTAQK